MGLSTIGSVVSAGFKAIIDWDEEKKHKHVALFFTNKDEGKELAHEISNDVAEECMDFLKIINVSNAEDLGKHLGLVAYAVILATNPNTHKGNIRQLMKEAIRSDKLYKEYMGKVQKHTATAAAKPNAIVAATAATAGAVPNASKPPVPPKPIIPTKLSF